MNYHDIGVTICDTVTKARVKPLTDEQRSVVIAAVAVWLDKKNRLGQERMRERCAALMLEKRVMSYAKYAAYIRALPVEE